MLHIFRLKTINGHMGNNLLNSSVLAHLLLEFNLAVTN